MDLTKRQIIEIGEKLKVPWIHTWSCYRGKIIHCGTCPTCLARKEAFQLAKVADPTAYKDVPGLVQQS